MPNGAIRPISIQENASLRDLKTQLRSMGIFNESSVLRLDGTSGTLPVLSDDSAYCKDCISPNDILLVLSTNRAMWGRKGNSGTRKGGSNQVGQLVLPTESLVVLEHLLDTRIESSLAIVAGHRNDNSSITKGAMVFRIPFKGAEEQIVSADILKLLSEMRNVQLICNVSGFNIMGVAVSINKSLSPRNLYICKLIADYLDIKNMNLIRCIER